MSEDNKKIGNVIEINQDRIEKHLGEIVRGTVEETLNSLLDTEANRIDLSITATSLTLPCLWEPPRRRCDRNARCNVASDIPDRIHRETLPAQVLYQ